MQEKLELPDDKIKIEFDSKDRGRVSKRKWSGFKFCDESWGFRIRFEFAEANYRKLAVRVNGSGSGDASFTLPENCPVKYTNNIPIADKIGEKLKFENAELLDKCKDILNEMLSIVKKS